MTNNYPQDLDVVWLASDKNGAVAAFITAGKGPIPQNALKYRAMNVADCEEEVLALPVSSDFQALISVPRLSGYSDFASRGMYVYDWRDIHRSSANETRLYELTAIPTQPIEVATLPLTLNQFASSIHFEAIDFSDNSYVDPSHFFECASGY